MDTINLKLTPALRAALLQSVEMSIDILNDMALDSLHFNPKELRELATKSDEEIRAKINQNLEEAWRQIEQLTSLQLLYSDLK